MFAGINPDDIHQITWNFGDGSRAIDTLPPTYSYVTPGVYTVTLTATGPGGSDTLTRTNYITVTEPLSAAFSAEPLTGAAPLTVTFTSTSTGASTWLWDFGDGYTQTITSSLTQSAPPSALTTTHTYARAGVYTVGLTVEGATGTGSITKSGYITVSDPVQRVTGGLQVLYTFAEGSGTTVHDLSGVGDPLDLMIANETAVTWLSGGLSLDTATILTSGVTATKIISAAMANNELTIEAWLTPANATQDGPARIVSLSADTSHRNFTLGQQSDAYDVRLRTTGTDDNGRPSVSTESGSLNLALTHVVYTRAASGQATMYLNNVAVVTGTVGGDLSNWTDSYPLALGNELTEDRPWLGELYLVAVYGRALSGAEVGQNYEAGPNPVARPSLALSKAGPALAAPGEPITYTLTVTNSGTAEATNLVITDTVPANASYVSGGTLSGTNVVSWTVPALAAGGGVTETTFVVTATQTITNGDYAVTTDGGFSAAGQKEVTTQVYPRPVALFSGSPLTGTAPLTVTFANSSTYVTDYLWNFGDGASLTVTNPTHRYDEPGVYTVSLRADGPGGSDTLTRTGYITVESPTEVVTATIGTTGGILTAPSSGVQVEFPGGAVTQTVVVTYTELMTINIRAVVTPFLAFSLEAASTSNPLQSVRAFSQPYTITVPFEESVCDNQPDPGCEDIITLFWTEGNIIPWHPISSSQVLTDDNKVTATLDHTANLAAMTASDSPLAPPKDIVLPSVTGVGPSEFTGAATVDIPIELPPLPGEVPLNLSLHYSSDTINNIRNDGEVRPTCTEDEFNDDDCEVAMWRYRTQASVYGLGWDLAGLPAISRGPTGPFGGVLPMPYLNLNGARVMYYNFDGSNNNPKIWETHPLSFDRIVNNRGWNCGTNDWRCINEFVWGLGDRNDYGRQYEVWDHNGTHYVFAEQQRYKKCFEEKWFANSYHVTQITDSHGNRVEIDYFREGTVEGICIQDPENQHSNKYGQEYDRAVLPSSIDFYPNGSTIPTVRVQFEILKDRLDNYMKEEPYKLSEQIGLPSYSKYRVASITVEVRTDGSNWSIYRRYRLDNHGPANSEYYVWRPGDVGDYGHMLLRSIQVSGSDGTALPSHTFRYSTDADQQEIAPADYAWNHVRLTEVNNGYGGKINFEYGLQTTSCSGWVGGTINRYVVNKIKTIDGVSSSTVSQQQFDYSDPKCRIDYLNEHSNYTKKTSRVAWFMGFGKVTKRNQKGNGELINIATTEYITTVPRDRVGEWPHAAAGQPAKVQIQLSEGGPVLKESENIWEFNKNVITVPNAPGWDLGLDWARKTRETQTLDGKTSTTDYVYNNTSTWPFNYGYPDRILERGEAGNQDDKQTIISYLHPSDPNIRYDILGLKKQVELYGDTNGDGTFSLNERLRHTQYYYDQNLNQQDLSGSLNLNNVPTKGELNATIAFNAGGQPVQVETRTIYDQYGNQTKVKDANDNLTVFEYDTLHHAYVTKITNPRHSTTYVPNYALGVIDSETDPNGQMTQYRYDDLGRLLRVSLPGDDLDIAPTKIYSYSDVNGVVQPPFQVTVQQRDDDGSGSPTYLTGYYFYNGLGQLIESQLKVSDCGLISVEKEYNAQGLLERESYPRSINAPGCIGTNPPATYTVYGYDGLGRQTTTTFPDGRITLMSYSGWNQTLTDAESRQRTNFYDAFGRLTQVQEPGGFQTSYTYNAADELVQVEDNDHNITTIAYDRLGRKVKMNDPDMGEWHYRYDAVGNLVTQIDAKRQVVNMYYDELNRLRGKAYDLGPADPATYPYPPPVSLYAVEYIYDQNDSTHGEGIGRRTQMYDAAGTVDWTYDDRGRVEVETRDFTSVYGNQLYNSHDSEGAYTIHYTYDSADRIRTMTYPDGEVVTTDYNDRGLPYQLTAPGINYATATTYDEQARLRQLDLGNGLVTYYDYYAPDDPGQRGDQLMSLQVDGFSIGGGTLLDLHYDQYDRIGNIKQITDQTAEQRLVFDYDDLDRLTDAAAGKLFGGSGTVPDYHHQYDYDSIGNITQKIVNVGLVNETAIDYFYKEHDDRPHLVRQTSEGDSYDYDANGNMSVRVEGGGVYTQTWDIENRLKQVTWLEDGQPYTTTFVYDGDGNRLLKIEELPPDDETTTVYIGKIYEEKFDTSTDAQLILDRFDGYGGDNTSNLESLYWLNIWDFSNDENWNAFDWSSPYYLDGWPWKTVTDRVNFIEGEGLRLHSRFYKEQPDGNGVTYYVTQVTADLIYALTDLDVDSRFTDEDFVILTIKYDNPPIDEVELRLASDTGGSYYYKIIDQNITTAGVRYYKIKKKEFVKYNYASWDSIAFTYLMFRRDIGPYGSPAEEKYFYIDDLRIVKADPDEAMSYNDTGQAWDKAASTGADAGEWHVYEGNRAEEPNKPFSYGQIKTTTTPNQWYLSYKSLGHTITGTIKAGLFVKDVDGAGGLSFFIQDVTPDSWQMYAVEADSSSNQISLVRWVDGTRTVIETADFTFAPNQILWLGVDTNDYDTDSGRLRVYASLTGENLFLTGNEIISAQDTTLGSGGSVGLLSHQANVRFVNFLAGSTTSLTNAVRKNYFFDNRLVATRQDDELYFIHSDHLGSTSLTTCGANCPNGLQPGEVVAQSRYLPYGEERWTAGEAKTDFTFTGQRKEGFGLMDYNARYYDPILGRFISADTVVPEPGNPQSLNRYSYVYNNPVKFSDPSGHCPPSICRDEDGKPIDAYYRYGDSAVMDALPLSGLNPWFPVDVVAPPYLSPRPDPDAISARISVSPEQVLPNDIAHVGAFEALYNYHTGDTTFFGIAGLEGHIGGGITPEIVAISDVFNIGNNNLNYAGNFRSVEMTGAYIIGASPGYSWVPNADEGSPYARSVGVVVGIGGKLQVSQTEYIPLLTIHSDEGITTHANEYLHNPKTQGFITDYYRKLYDAMQPYIGE